jgi:hypothetical protein
MSKPNHLTVDPKKVRERVQAYEKAAALGYARYGKCGPGWSAVQLAAFWLQIKTRHIVCALHADLHKDWVASRRRDMRKQRIVREQKVIWSGRGAISRDISKPCPTCPTFEGIRRKVGGRFSK